MKHHSRRFIDSIVPACMAIVLAACGGGSVSVGVVVPIEKPAIAAAPANQSVVEGKTAAFTVTATGGGALAYQWKKNGTDISGATNSTYTTPATTIADDGTRFSVVVSNSAGSVTSNEAKLGVSATALKPAIATQPAAQSVITGETATFTVTATGTSPFSYQWKKNGVNIPSATSDSYTTPATSISDSGLAYSVVVTNSAGMATSNDARLTVTAAAVKPAIDTDPAAQTVTEGQTAMFTVTATGTAPLIYQWKKNGTDIEGATSSTYTTPATSIADNTAVFSVVVTNSAGTVTSSGAALTVNAAAVAPAITTQPTALSITAGATATFSVVATGTSLSYQWKKNGVSITGGTGATSNSYTTPALSFAGNGAVYSVEVSNSAGSVTSSTATLTVSKTSTAQSYGYVANASDGLYDKTECVQDNHTGLIWEGKTASGTTRALDALYSNYHSTNAQNSAYNNVSQAQVDAPGNSIGYVNSVNAGNGLCGSTNWRLPTEEELRGIVDVTQSPAISSTWFSNTALGNYWSSSPLPGSQLSANVVCFGVEPGNSAGSCTIGLATPTLRYNTISLRLVRDQ